MGNSILTLDIDVMAALLLAQTRLKIAGINTIITSTKRSSSEQQRLFADFQKGLRRFPVARPGTSLHETGRAVDIVPIDPADLPRLVAIMRSSGFRWAGSRDRVHFDIPKRGIVAGLVQESLGAGVRPLGSLLESGVVRPLTRTLSTRPKAAPSKISTKKRLTTITDIRIC